MTDRSTARTEPVVYYTTDERCEGKQAYLEKRKPDFSRFKRYP
jgi:naphthoate synthase